jgi:hypothetical protein
LRKARSASFGLAAELPASADATGVLDAVAVADATTTGGGATGCERTGAPVAA